MGHTRTGKDSDRTLQGKTPEGQFLIKSKADKTVDRGLEGRGTKV